MTTSLTVLAKPTPKPNTFDVFWACGRNTQGVVTVAIGCVTESDQVAAELSVLQYLLEVREVCGQDRTGNSLLITCSLGAIKKLARGQSDKTSLVPFALFLRTRFFDAEVAVSKDEGFIAYAKANNHPEQLVVDSPRLSKIQLADGLAVGITHHALVAYMTRYQNPLAANAWRALRAAMSHPGLRLQRSTQEETNQYGKSIRVFDNPEGLRLVIAMEHDGAKLLTCYYVRSAARNQSNHR
jgi:hypothetical protein